MHKINFIDRLVLLSIFGLMAFFVIGQLFASTTIKVQVFYYFRHALEIIVILSFSYLIFNITKLRNLSAFTLVVLLWISWLVPSSLMWASETTLRVYLQEKLLLLLFWPLMYLVFYIFSVNNPSSDKFIMRLFMCLAVICCCMFVFIFDYRNAIPTRSAISGETLASLNQIYYPLSLLPWILMIRKSTFRFICISIIAVLVFYSMKRTALIAFSLSIIAYLAVQFIMRPRMRLIYLISPLILTSIIVMLFYYYDEMHGGYFSYRFSNVLDDQGSGRLEIYRDTIAMICGSSSFDLFMGHGFDMVAVDSLYGLSAHCDWLEVIYDFGLIGLILYTLMHILLIVNARSLIRAKAPFAAAFSAAYILFHVISITSHLIIYPSYFIFIVTFWGMIEGQAKENSQPVNDQIFEVLSPENILKKFPC